MLAIIPARGGSRGIPRKNLKDLNGHPLIYYTIIAAQKSRYIDQLILSTDDPEIAGVASQYGVEIPFMRPEDLATDTSRAIDTYIYTVERLNREHGTACREFVVLQPTSPLRTAEDIDNAVQVFIEKRADSVISVTETSPPEWALKIDSKGVLKNYFSGLMEVKNRQELEPAFMPNGAVFVFKLSLLKESGTYYSSKTYPSIMPPERSVDIDNQHDFEIAQFLMRRQ